MSILTTARFLLKKYTAGSDPHPTRDEFNTMIDAIENNGAIYGQGLASARPAAGTRGRFYATTDTPRKLYYDDGANWVDCTPIGGGGAGRPILISGSAAEGSSPFAARADHTHLIPAASSSTAGSMSVGDKDKLDAATPTASPSSLARRDASGRASFASPVDPGHAATKSYVDGQLDLLAEETDDLYLPDRTIVKTASPMAGTGKPAGVPWTRFTGFIGTSTGAGGNNRLANLATDVNGYGGFWFGEAVRGGVLPQFKGIYSVTLTAHHFSEPFMYDVIVQNVTLDRVRWRAHRLEPDGAFKWAHNYGGIDMHVEILGWE